MSKFKYSPHMAAESTPRGKVSESSRLYPEYHNSAVTCVYCWYNNGLNWIANLRWGVWGEITKPHYNEVIMSAMASQITGVVIVCSTVCWGTDQRKHQSSASLAFVRGIHRWPVNSPRKGPVTRKMFPLVDVIMFYLFTAPSQCNLIKWRRGNGRTSAA